MSLNLKTRVFKLVSCNFQIWPQDGVVAEIREQDVEAIQFLSSQNFRFSLTDASKHSLMA
jgi:hypothetical protein